MGFIGKINYEPIRQYHERVAEKRKKPDPFPIITVQNVQLISPFQEIKKEQFKAAKKKQREVKSSSSKKRNLSSARLAQTSGKGRYINEYA